MENALRTCCKGIKIGNFLIHRDGDNEKQFGFNGKLYGLYSYNESDMHESYSFTVITSDGSLLQIEISYGQGFATFLKYICNNGSHLRNNVFCFDHHHELNLFVVVHTKFDMYVFGLLSQLFAKLYQYSEGMLDMKIQDLVSIEELRIKRADNHGIVKFGDLKIAILYENIVVRCLG
ncbi:hypothetical protein P8452_12916 [Trifolium repens]|nr:hypothetical protein P8452_12916 [Trifolium repens]